MKKRRPIWPSFFLPACLCKFIDETLLSISQIRHVNVCSQPDVIRQVPADVIGIVINNDVISIPVPVSTVAQIIGRYAEVESAEPKPARAASREMPDVARSKAACESSMLVRVIHMIVSIIPSRIMADPLAVRVDVGSIWVTALIVKSSRRRPGARCAPKRSRATGRSVRGGKVGMAATFAVLLSENRNR